MKKSSKILAVLMAALMLLSSLAVSAFAATDSKESAEKSKTGKFVEWSWNTKTKTATFNGIKPSKRANLKTKTIPNKIKHGQTVTKIGKQGFQGCKKLKKIVVKCKKAPKVTKGAFKGLGKKIVVVATNMSAKQFKLLKKNFKKAGFKGTFKRK